LFWAKYEYDGSCLGDLGRADFGGLIRHGDSAWIIGFNGNLVIANNMFVGLKISKEACCNHFFCSSDSNIVLDLISKDHNLFHCYVATIANMNDLLKLKWKVYLFHSLREENSCAKFLTKLNSANDAKLSILETSPSNMQYLSSCV
jgi:hypothetical protein